MNEKKDFYIECSDIHIVTKKETDSALNEIDLNFFDYELIKDYVKSSSQELFDFLQERAYSLGFKLFLNHGLSQNSIKIRCYLHGHNGKNPDINTNCPFFINITKFKGDSMEKYHVTQVLNEHNHKLNHEIFAHKILSKEQKDFIHLMSTEGISPTKISVLFFKKYKIRRTREQITYVSIEEKKILV